MLQLQEVLSEYSCARDRKGLRIMTRKEIEDTWIAFVEESYSGLPKLKDILLESTVLEDNDGFIILLPALTNWSQVHWMRRNILGKLRASFYGIHALWGINVTISENPFYPPEIIIYD